MPISETCQPRKKRVRKRKHKMSPFEEALLGSSTANKASETASSSNDNNDNNTSESPPAAEQKEAQEFQEAHEVEQPLSNSERSAEDVPKKKSKGETVKQKKAEEDESSDSSEGSSGNEGYRQFEKKEFSTFEDLVKAAKALRRRAGGGNKSVKDSMVIIPRQDAEKQHVFFTFLEPSQEANLLAESRGFPRWRALPDTKGQTCDLINAILMTAQDEYRTAGESLPGPRAQLPDLESVRMCVVEEHTKKGQRHHHVYVNLRKRCKLVGFLPKVLQKLNVPGVVHVGNWRGASHSDFMLRYMTVPTDKKYDPDPKPYWYGKQGKFGGTMELRNAITKAEEKMKRPARNTEVFAFICARMDVKSPADFRKLVDKKFDEEKSGVRRVSFFLRQRLSAWLAHEPIKREQDLELYLLRREEGLHRGWTFKKWMDTALLQPCQCTTFGEQSSEKIDRRKKENRSQEHEYVRNKQRTGRKFQGDKIDNMRKFFYYLIFEYDSYWHQKDFNLFLNGTTNSNKSTALANLYLWAPPGKIWRPQPGNGKYCLEDIIDADDPLLGICEEWEHPQDTAVGMLNPFLEHAHFSVRRLGKKSLRCRPAPPNIFCGNGFF